MRLTMVDQVTQSSAFCGRTTLISSSSFSRRKIRAPCPRLCGAPLLQLDRVGEGRVALLLSDQIWLWSRGHDGGGPQAELLRRAAREVDAAAVQLQGEPWLRFLDGDLKSGSLHAFYGGECSRPPSEDAVAFRKWALADLDAMAEDGTSRLLDVSGGSDVMGETLQELEIPAFCEGVGARFTWLTVLGPDPEDFQHVRAAVDAGHLLPHHMLLVLNEGAIRRGQNATGAFAPVASHPDFVALVDAGARMILLPRLTIMDELRAGRLDFYDVAAGKPDAAGNKPKATWAFMAKRWTQDVEAQIVKRGVQSWMP